MVGEVVVMVGEVMMGEVAVVVGEMVMMGEVVVKHSSGSGPVGSGPFS